MPPLREPVCEHLAEALSWLVAHSQTSPDALAPGSLELAEVLWLAQQMPEPPRPLRRRKEALPEFIPPPDREHPTMWPGLRPEPLEVENTRKLTLLPPDPFLPSPFPGDEEQLAPKDTLLPVAVLPDEQDVARDVEGLLPGRVREDKPLGDREMLLRALTPLLRRRPDRSRHRFAEEPTVDLYAQTGVLQPVFEPSQGPSFDEVVLICDGGVSMQAWRRQAKELQNVLASTQVFPRVRLEELQPGPVEITKDPAVRESAVKQLSGVAQLLPGSRPLLLCLSDTAGRHWWDGRMFAALETWGRICPTAILHPLPIWHWNRTALAAVERVSVRNASPAAANPVYWMDPLNWWDQPLPLGRDLPLPVLPLEQQALGAWSAVVMGHAADATPGVALLPGPQREQRLRQLLGDRDLSAPSPAPEPLTAKEAAARWEAFQAMASPEAQQLMKAMATSPLLTLPVIRLLQAAQGSKVSSPLPIAEVLTSGLVVRKLDPPTNNKGDEEASPKPMEAEKYQFEVLSEVAALLQQQLPATERRDVISRVSALVERRWNRIRRSDEPSFEAVLCDPAVQPPERLKNGFVQFASVTARLLDTLPGDEAKAFAERIRRGSGLPPGSPWPSSMVFDEVEFETALLIHAPPLQAIPFTTARFEELELRPIPFTTATLKSDHTIQERPGTAWGFHDPLQRDHLPFAAPPPPASADLVTAAQCKEFFGRDVTPAQLADLNACLNRFEIDTPARIAHFMAQIAHESGGLQWLEEIADGSAYEGRFDLGNTRPGDGPRFKGAGVIQLTGRGNYEAFSEFIGDPQVMEGCSYVASHYPFTSAGFWWHNNQMNEEVDGGASCRRISRLVNGRDPANGLSEREAYYAKATQIFNASTVAQPTGAATADQADPLALTLVEIPAGRFLMGSPPDEFERSDDEGPQHEVELASFFISQTPITQAQWREVAQWQPREGERWERELEPSPSWFTKEADKDQRPVEQVSWEEAMEFCRRLSQRTGRHYTLPSEAQWEYACRAGTTTPFAFGETITPELVNYNGTYTYGNGPKGAYRQQTTPVGMFPANAWGLEDMHGNVWEWCLDDEHESYEGAPVDGSAWVDGEAGEGNKGEGGTKLLRGGSWINYPRSCRSAPRYHALPDDAFVNFGFRVVCLPQGPSLNA